MKDLEFGLPSHSCGRAGSQRGAVLVIALIFLTLMTLIGVTAYSVATQEERMAGNSRDRLRAFEAAEAALRHCERRVSAMSDAEVLDFPATDDPHNKYTEMYGPPSVKAKWEQIDEIVPLSTEKYWNTPYDSKLEKCSSNDPVKLNRCARQLPAGSVPGVYEQPRCVVQQLSRIGGNASQRAELPQASTFAYEITARGVGANRSAVVLLQSTLLRH